MSEHEPAEAFDLHLDLDEAGRPPKALEAFARVTGAVAHEFKNLLLVIGGLTELVLSRPDLERTARRDLEDIRRATEQADELTHRLFALARKPTARPRLVSPNGLICSLEHLLARLLGEKISLCVELAEGLGSVSVDPVELEQSVLNLVLNARDALPQGGEIHVATGRVEIAPGTPGVLSPGRYVALRVSDDGIGMDDATRAHLFEPFFTTKEPGRGSGLGLSLVRSFVMRAGGEVHVRSGLGAGTTVELLLPEREARASG
jgi:two-component system, cell cycle sensor histidine kinase and response regulator CckA